MISAVIDWPQRIALPDKRGGAFGGSRELI
jgi:hypothetical protein